MVHISLRADGRLGPGAGRRARAPICEARPAPATNAVTGKGTGLLGDGGALGSPP